MRADRKEHQQAPGDLEATVRLPFDGKAGLLPFYIKRFPVCLFVCLLGFKGASTASVILRPS